MNSLYHVLTDRHREEFAPVRCNEHTITRLVRYFEDVVAENKLSALVIAGRCLNGNPERETKRLAKLAASARWIYLSSCNSECDAHTWDPKASLNVATLVEDDYHRIETGPFIVVMEPRFSGLLASCLIPDQRTNHTKLYEMVWTFDPNVIFTASEYLIARMSAEAPQERDRLERLLNDCAPHSPSLRLALSFTTKVTMLMQRQNELEMATNRISSAISSALEIEPILQSAVEEVGLALKARRAALVLWQEGSNLPEGMTVYERPEETRRDAREANTPLKTEAKRSPDSQDDRQAEVSQAHAADNNDGRMTAPLEVPISYGDNVMGELVVEDDTTFRNWEDEEVLMVKTASDQLSVAITHARLFRKVQNQAMTDALTGLYNRGYFQERLDRETKLADRNNEQVSLILLDLDYLKGINDTYGHRSGDAALRHVASIMKATVREVDICARYGGEEFAVLLPQCSRESALDVAERLRHSIALKPVPRVGQVTASIGLASYPSGAKNRDELVEMADRALYLAKNAGRNRVRTLAHGSYTGIDAK